MSAPAKHTPGPLELQPAFRDGDLLSVVYVSEDNKTFPIAEEVGGRRHGADFEDESECVANAHLIVAAPDLLAVAESFEVRAPDADGDVWLVIHESNASGQGGVNLGKADRIVAQVALLLEESRRAALAKARGGA